MIYLDNGATSFCKPATVRNAVLCALENCANPGRGGYAASMTAAKTVLRCRERAAAMFSCLPEQVVLTHNCTHGLNIAIGTLVKSGCRVVISGFEHNAVTRPLHHRGAVITVAGQKLFDWEDTLSRFEDALKQGQDAAVFTHVSNVFGYILPVEEMAGLCRKYRVPFIVDAAQSAGSLPICLQDWGADFIAMPGHKGLLGPQGTGLLLCAREPEPLLQGGTGSNSANATMPDFLPDVAEAGTHNVCGIAGLKAGIEYVQEKGTKRILEHEQKLKNIATEILKQSDRLELFASDNTAQSGVLSIRCRDMDNETLAAYLSEKSVCVRSGLHCAPLAHESAGTLKDGTVRLSFSPFTCEEDVIKAAEHINKYLR